MSSFARCFASDSCSAYKNHSATDIKSKWLKSGCKRGKKQKRIWNKYSTPPACKASSSAACLRAMASAFAFWVHAAFSAAWAWNGTYKSYKANSKTETVWNLCPLKALKCSTHWQDASPAVVWKHLWSNNRFRPTHLRGFLLIVLLSLRCFGLVFTDLPTSTEGAHPNTCEGLPIQQLLVPIWNWSVPLRIYAAQWPDQSFLLLGFLLWQLDRCSQQSASAYLECRLDRLDRDQLKGPACDCKGFSKWDHEMAMQCYARRITQGWRKPYLLPEGSDSQNAVSHTSSICPTHLFEPTQPHRSASEPSWVRPAPKITRESASIILNHHGTSWNTSWQDKEISEMGKIIDTRYDNLTR